MRRMLSIFTLKQSNYSFIMVVRSSDFIDKSTDDKKCSGMAE